MAGQYRALSGYRTYAAKFRYCATPSPRVEAVRPVNRPALFKRQVTAYNRCRKKIQRQYMTPL